MKYRLRGTVRTYYLNIWRVLPKMNPNSDKRSRQSFISHEYNLGSWLQRIAVGIRKGLRIRCSRLSVHLNYPDTFKRARRLSHHKECDGTEFEKFSIMQQCRHIA